MKKLKADVIVIGAGAAGLMAAGTAAKSGAQVLLLERNDRPGVKLRITGKGRCNITNCCDVPEVLKNIPRNARFLQSVLHAFPPQAAMDFFEELGVPLKVERGNRVFPRSDQAADVVHALENWTKAAGVAHQQGTAREITVQNKQVTGVKTQNGDWYEAPGVILASGGCSYPKTGSDGSGYALASALGHSIVPTEGSLVPLEAQGEDCAELQGLSLRNVGVRLCREDGKAVFTDFGELLFTHFGLSGPTVLSASAHLPKAGLSTLYIDLKPALDEPALDRRMLRDFETYKNRDLENGLTDLYPKSLIPVLLRHAGLTGREKVNAVTRAQRRALLETTKRFSVTITGKRPVEEAIVTSGGVDVRQVDPKTMCSRLVTGLSFAGEVLDVDAYTGGFNLQIAWATGRAAGDAVCAQLQSNAGGKP